MKILVLDKNHHSLLDKLNQKGFKIEEDYTSTYDEICLKIHNFEGIIIRSRIPIDKKLLVKAKNLKFIARVGSGMENINTKFAENNKIILINSPEGNSDSLAEHTIGMLLNLMHRISITDKEVRNNIWLREENRGDELMGKTIGLLGYGIMAKAFAKRLIGFGVEVIYYDILNNVGDDLALQVPLQGFFEKTDILSIHIPLNKDTIYIVNNTYIQRFKKNIYFINTARGKNVITKDIIVNLKNGKIKGACLDVIEYEKSSFESLDKNEDLFYLQQSDKVILTPHIAGWSNQSNEKMANIIVDKIEKLYNT